jgi:GNAT superfamily N-acetyltransferase
MTPTDLSVFPFADLSLARRLEKAEAVANRDFVKARAAVFPQSGATYLEVAGTHAMFDGPASPITQTFCLGMFAPITDADMDQLEDFFSARNADVFHEVCPMADESAFALLSTRCYKAIEFSSVLYRPINAQITLSREPNNRLRVRKIEPADREVWARTTIEGWSEFEGLEDFLSQMAAISPAREALDFVAELDGATIGTGSMFISDDVALLAGASTIPAARRQGAQLALLEYRLRYAAEHGCEIAIMAALPGSASQRNAERNGFRIAYTRTKWHLPWETN